MRQCGIIRELFYLVRALSTRIKKIIKLLKGLLQRFNKEQPSVHPKAKPTIIPRSDHTISRTTIHRNALKVLYRLHQEGYQAYLVGGCVRDLLLGRQPKDFDIATNALPEEMRKLFRNCRLIGRRFRLAHILFGKDIIEVATFRTHHENAQEHHGKTHDGLIIRDNVYGTIEDDVWRRDFSINALYYNIADFSIVDYTGGMADIKAKRLRMIGQPEQRFQEDPVRLLRAVRFMGKLNIEISPETEACLAKSSHLLTHVSPARLFQEVLKFFQEGATVPTFKLLQQYNLFQQLFPQTLFNPEDTHAQQLIDQVLINTDQRIAEGKSISPAFLITAFLWPSMNQQARLNRSEGMPAYVSLEKAIQTMLTLQTQRLAIPRNVLVSMRDICLLQYHLMSRQGYRPYRTLDHPRFRAAYDLLLLRSTAGEPVEELALWWTEFQKADRAGQEQLIKRVATQHRPKKKRPYNRKKKVT